MNYHLQTICWQVATIILLHIIIATNHAHLTARVCPFSIGFNENIIIYYVTSKMIPIKMYVGGEQETISYNIITSHGLIRLIQ